MRLNSLTGYTVRSILDEGVCPLLALGLNVVISIIRLLLPGNDVSPELLWRLCLGLGFEARAADGLSGDGVLLKCDGRDILIESE